MILFIEGVLEEAQPARAVINAGGVGYELLIPLSTFDRLPRPGSPCRLLTYHHVREDAELLYGFFSPEERDVFERLLSVNGIGPKTALTALSGLSRREFVRAVAEGDVKRLSSVSGIGRKTAERIVTELKDRFSEAEILEAMDRPTTGHAEDPKRRDLAAALVALGYKPAEAQRMAQAIPAEEVAARDVEHLLRQALKAR
jgi:Holliday junction DNA helicase RuvA